MTKKAFIAALLILIILSPVFAGFDFSFGSDFSITVSKEFDTEGFANKAEAGAYVEVTYAEENLTADVKGTVSLSSNDSAEYDFEKIFASYVVNDFEDKTLTLTAGKFPSTWGLGYINGYKIGNIINPEDKEYSVLASQSLDKGWAVEVQAVLPIFENEAFKIGAQGRKDLSMEVIKEARACAVFNPTDNVISLAAAANLSHWADITVGAEFNYNYDENADEKTELTLAASAQKSFEIKKDGKTMPLTDALALEVSFSGSEHQTKLINKATLGLSDKIDLYSTTKLAFGSATEFEETVGATYTIEKGLEAAGSLTFSHADSTNEVKLTASLSYKY